MTREPARRSLCGWVLCVLGPLGVLAVTACARVKPYERETLARPAMQQPVFETFERHEQHLFRVREASAGATGASGGGCGCN